MRQAPSGQRVNTDSCVFGGVIGAADDKPKRILDIGSGTGVLTLMLAIRFPESHITAVEPEQEIAVVAKENFSNSKWSDRITLKTLRAQELCPKVDGRYDFVLCNPPYFQNSMFSPDRLRTVARHNADLSPEELYQSMSKVTTDDGSIWVSFPEDDTALWLEKGYNENLSLTHHIVIKDHPGARPHMTIAGWSKKTTNSVSRAMINYRLHHRGPQSEWMKNFRAQWYPAKYNDQFAVPH